MTDRLHVAETLAAAAREISSAQDLPTTLLSIVQTASSLLPGVDQAGITVAYRRGRGKGRIETVAATDQLVCRLDSMQYELDEGPCLYAIDSAPLTVVEHARHEQRWPRYIRAAVQEGLRAQMGVRLYANDHTRGALNLYAWSVDEFEDDTVHMAGLFATHAALAIGHARQADQLASALAGRSAIGKAIGILMAKYGLTDDRAFEYLIRVSSHTNVKMRDVAAEVLAQQSEANARRSDHRCPPDSAVPRPRKRA